MGYIFNSNHNANRSEQEQLKESMVSKDKPVQAVKEKTK